MQIVIGNPAQSKLLYDTFLLPYFPDEERKPYFMIDSGMKDGRYTVLLLEDEGEILAAAFLLSAPKVKAYLLDYFSVLEYKRNQGYGSELLNACLNYVQYPILIETESLETSETEWIRRERIDRNRFYQRNGAQSCAFSVNLFHVVYDIWVLTNGQVPDKDSLIHALSEIYRANVTDPKMYEKNVIIPWITNT